MLRIPWMQYESNEEVLREIGTTRTKLLTIRKRMLTFLGHVMKKIKKAWKI